MPGVAASVPAVPAPVAEAPSPEQREPQPIEAPAPAPLVLGAILRTQNVCAGSVAAGLDQNQRRLESHGLRQAGDHHVQRLDHPTIERPTGGRSHSRLQRSRPHRMGRCRHRLESDRVRTSRRQSIQCHGHQALELKFNSPSYMAGSPRVPRAHSSQPGCRCKRAGTRKGAPRWSCP